MRGRRFRPDRGRFGKHREAIKQGRLLEAVVLASRALLVTRGEQANSELEALELFANCSSTKAWSSQHLEFSSVRPRPL